MRAGPPPRRLNHRAMLKRQTYEAKEKRRRPGGGKPFNEGKEKRRDRTRYDLSRDDVEANVSLVETSARADVIESPSETFPLLCFSLSFSLLLFLPFPYFPAYRTSINLRIITGTIPRYVIIDGHWARISRLNRFSLGDSRGQLPRNCIDN